jgi:hypothetical protein
MTESRAVFHADVFNRKYTITQFDAKRPMTARGGMGSYPSGYQVRVIEDVYLTTT